MEGLGHLLAQSVLHRIKEIEIENDIDNLIACGDSEVSYEAKLLKARLNDLKATLKEID